MILYIKLHPLNNIPHQVRYLLMISGVISIPAKMAPMWSTSNFRRPRVSCSSKWCLATTRKTLLVKFFDSTRSRVKAELAFHRISPGSKDIKVPKMLKVSGQRFYRQPAARSIPDIKGNFT